MAAEMIGGAFLGAAASELFKAVLHGIAKLMGVQSDLKKLKTTLELVIPKVEEIQRRLDRQQRGADHHLRQTEINKLLSDLEGGILRIQRCTNVPSWIASLKWKYSRGINKLAHYLAKNLKIFQPQTTLLHRVRSISLSSNGGGGETQLVIKSKPLIYGVDASVDRFCAPNGFGRTSLCLSHSLDLKVLLRAPTKTITQVKLGKATVYLTSKGGLMMKEFKAELSISKKLDELMEQDRLKKFQRYMESVRSIRSENVSPLRAYYYSYSNKDVKIMLVYNYHSQGSIRRLLHESGMGPFGWELRHRVAIGVAKGIACIHTQDSGGLSHGNIDCCSVYLNANNYGCIANVGQRSGRSLLMSLDDDSGNRPYRNHQEEDIHDYGYLLLQLLTGKEKGAGSSPWSSYIWNNLDGVPGFIAGKHLSRREGAFKFVGFAPELSNECAEAKNEMLDMLRIALNCIWVSVYQQHQRPKIDDVVKMVERIPQGLDRHR